MSLARAAVVAIAALQFSFGPETGGTPMIGVAEVPSNFLSLEELFDEHMAHLTHA